jgi:hypothetical protein
MHKSKRLTGILIACTLAAAGCADPVSLSGPGRTASGPTFDGIGWAGSGNRIETDSTTSFATGSSTTAEAPTGLGWAGSGN